MKRFITFLLVMLSICFCAFSQSKPVVVVAPFDAKDIEQSEMDILTEVFISEYANTRKADVVDRNSFDKKEMLSDEVWNGSFGFFRKSEG